MKEVAILSQEIQGFGQRIRAMLDDMAFNLAPQADAYQKDNAEHEAAIACAEALARVPQQVIKWGYRATEACYPALYEVYYKQVIPHVRDNLKEEG